MRMRFLGKTGISVSELGFGGLFASSLGHGFEESRGAVRQAIEMGINFFDTAPAYADSEEILGRILAEFRSVPLILSTKIGGRPQPFDARDRAGLIQSVETSLRLLHREVIDVLLLHEPDRPQQYDWWTDPDKAQGPVLEVLDELKRRGWIRFTGLAGTTMAEMAHLMRSARFDVVLTAFSYSILYREATLEVLPTADQLGMGVLLGSVLHQGALGRRYDEVVRGKPIWMSQARQRQIQSLYSLLDDLGMPIVELCLRFAIGCPSASSVLIGPKTAKHVEDSVAAVAKGPLPSDVLARLDAIAAMVPGRPFEEPMILPMSNPHGYSGPGMANLGAGVKVGKL